MSESIPPEIQQQIGPFKLLEELGKGGFATVYRAEDTRLHRQVALKLLHAHLASNPTLVRRFMGESRAASRTHHRNIVTIYDVGETDDHRPYFVMELLEGTILSKLIEEHRGPDRQPPAQAPAIISQLASALDYLHRFGIVHRDLKPSNVMISDGDQVTLMDFGIARLLADQEHLTQTGQFVGTPIYIAPEQITGQEVGPAADIYSLGVLAYELYSGRPPFQGDTVRVLHAHVYEPPPALESLRPGLPQGIYRAIAAALAKNPAERPATASAFAAMIVAASSPPGPATVTQSQYPSASDSESTIKLRPQAPSSTPAPPFPDRGPSVEGAPNTKTSAPLIVGGALGALLVLAAVVAGLLLTRSGRASPRRAGAPAPITQSKQSLGVSGSGVLAPSAGASIATTPAPTQTTPAVPAPSASAPILQPQPTMGVSSAGAASTPASTPTAAPVPPPVVSVSTLAGSASAGFADRSGGEAQFSSPADVAIDGSGAVYVADSANSRIRKITPNGAVTTLAGSGDKGLVDGHGGAAQFDDPTGLAVDSSGNVYVADTFNQRIRKITPSGDVTTLAGSGQSGLGGGGFADGPATTAQFRDPAALAVDAAGTLYVADKGNHRIRKVSPTGDVTTLAGSGVQGAASGGFADGPGAAARFNSPGAVTVDTAGNVYVADTFNQRIRKITPSGEVSTLAGANEQGAVDGSGAAARFRNPNGIAVDTAGNIYVADTSNHQIRKISPAGAVSTLAGSGKEGFADGPAASAEFDFPQGLAVDSAGSIDLADTSNQRIRKIASAPPGG